MHRAEDIEAVRRLAPFDSLPLEPFQVLAKAAYLQRFPRDVVLIEEGQPADTLNIILEGAVEMFSEQGGRRTTVAVYRPVTAFILAAVVKDAPNLMSARTIEPSRVLLVPAAVIRSLIREDSSFALAMIEELAVGFRGLVKTVKNLKLRNTTERIANYLVQLHAENDHARRLRLPMDKTTLASLLGMTRENLSRALAGLRAHGVRIDGQEVTFEDIDALRALANPNPLIDDPKS